MNITAAEALLRELKLWGVDHMYGIPGSSLNGLMNALRKEGKDGIRYIQVRHESAGAMAASAEYKLSGHIGVAFGSGGPGSTNLTNGLFDALMDGSPMLAIVAQSASTNQNTHAFQEMEMLPFFENVSVYNGKAMSAEQIPYMVNDAIRTAFERKGPAVLILHNDFMEEEIDYEPTDGAVKEIPKLKPAKPNAEEVAEIAREIRDAENPMLYLGRGAIEYRDLAVEVAEIFNLPVVTSAPSVGLSFPADHPNFMGSFGRLGTKPATESIFASDLILFVGSSHPFARFWPASTKVVQVNHSFREIGRQLKADDSLVADAGDFFKALLETGIARKEGPVLRAARRNMDNWRRYLKRQADREGDVIYYESVLQKVKEYAEDDAVFALGVGNNKTHAIRMLPLSEAQTFTMSGWFATLGYSTPAAIGAYLQYPDRQIWSIVGDGGFAMNNQEILTQAKYEMPIINVVVTDMNLGFIKHAQLEDFKDSFGVDIQYTDWAKVGEGLGAVAFNVSTKEELAEAFEEAIRLNKEGNRKPIVIDAHVVYEDPLDTAVMKIDPNQFSREEIDEYLRENDIEDQPLLYDLIDEECR
ncbi:MAG: thiamine pyrophosphate-binding protein [Peptoniphilus sp.]|nr:thiamine pyrophosphate-dependent enzyme [Peptoniphilus sp.]MDD7362678.1 thiamine pyrophosphate-binding protein [Bacillota bacterium]MDY6044923.1 thiamine pyrophosphate-binding protein [Peptoniphilus sp.]